MSRTSTFAKEPMNYYTSPCTRGVEEKMREVGLVKLSKEDLESGKYLVETTVEKNGRVLRFNSPKICGYCEKWREMRWRFVENPNRGKMILDAEGKKDIDVCFRKLLKEWVSPADKIVPNKCLEHGFRSMRWHSCGSFVADLDLATLLGEEKK